MVQAAIIKDAVVYKSYLEIQLSLLESQPIYVILYVFFHLAEIRSTSYSYLPLIKTGPGYLTVFVGDSFS